MSVLSDTIEQFIKDLMNQYEGKIELQRNELAQHFNCAPSQINYVLATRFTPDKGYIIESRRGGGGYIRVLRLSVETSEHLFWLVTTRIGEEISERDAHDVICRLVESDSIKKREGALMKAAVSDKALNIPAMLKDKIRASILKQMLLVLLSKEAE
ncbi:MAG: CtsR family transcriptional regulator [Christensenellales bacterium]|jgi:transcriptional regulator CtsR